MHACSSVAKLQMFYVCSGLRRMKVVERFGAKLG